ncbi:unnamed protein product [Caenorhabditis angaria]|uniref:Uncharacterized protein n=1 Tax=Caenorhabditis angaria TaxID=860376 RepID=A0A9P1IYV3_9PELO|nr:unnamed protein product [Caenorhabditis angaria]
MPKIFWILVGISGALCQYPTAPKIPEPIPDRHQTSSKSYAISQAYQIYPRYLPFYSEVNTIGKPYEIYSRRPEVVKNRNLNLNLGHQIQNQIQGYGMVKSKIPAPTFYGAPFRGSVIKNNNNENSIDTWDSLEKNLNFSPRSSEN